MTMKNKYDEFKVHEKEDFAQQELREDPEVESETLSDKEDAETKTVTFDRNLKDSASDEVLFELPKL